jgi:hypothetical protein
MTASTREEIRIGELVIRFLLEGGQSDGSVAVFEFDVPAGSKVAAAHSHDGFEETIYGLEGTLRWTLEGESQEVAPGGVLWIPAVPSTSSPMSATATPGGSRSSLRAFSVPTTSARSPRWSTLPPARQTWQRSQP